MNRTIRTAVLVSGGGTNLQAIIDAKQRGELPSVELGLVLSSRADAYALERAKENGIKTAVIASREHKHDFDELLLKTLKADGIELIVLAGFMRILGIDFVKAYENRIINVHPSLIPSFSGKDYYGLKVHEAALAYGVKVTGATVHFVNEIPDGGKIIMQKAVEVKEEDTPEALQLRVMQEAEWKLLPLALEKVAKQLLTTRR